MAHTIAPDGDRLPWLSDERTPKKRRSWNWPIAVVIAAAMFAVAAAAYWYGAMRYQSVTPAKPENTQRSTTKLPQIAPPLLPMDRDIDLAPMPQVEPAPIPAPVVIRQQPDPRPAIASITRRVVRHSRPPKASAPAARAEPEAETLQFSNPWESAGVSGRMVRIGTYANLQQGKKAWSQLARAFPGMKKLPAVVTDIPSLRNGKVYYRLQIGTTSQAHSEVLCQRMRTIGQSCVVVDLAGARKGSGDERQPIGI